MDHKNYSVRQINKNKGEKNKKEPNGGPQSIIWILTIDGILFLKPIKKH